MLIALAAGRTVGETVALYEQMHGETPDVENFLSVLADRGSSRHGTTTGSRRRSR